MGVRFVVLVAFVLGVRSPTSYSDLLPGFIIGLSCLKGEGLSLVK